MPIHTPSVSTQELALVEEAVKTRLILDSVDAWLLTQPTLINKRAKSLLPVPRLAVSSEKPLLRASYRGRAAGS